MSVPGGAAAQEGLGARAQARLGARAQARLGARAARARGLVIGISGPDGVGKTSLAAALAGRLGAEGRAVVNVHPYGCVVCRRLPASLRALPAEADGPDRNRLIRVRRAIHVLHGLIDAAELALQLGRVRRASRQAARGPVVVLADRSALDGLVKFRPRRGGALERVFRRLALGFDAILLLHASPGTLARRDGEHHERILAVLSERFDRAASSLPSVVRIDAERPFDEVVASAAAVIDPLLARSGAATRETAPAP